jgi:hypothetical protein
LKNEFTTGTRTRQVQRQNAKGKIPSEIVAG